MLPAAERLRKNHDFRVVFAQGRSFGGPFFSLRVRQTPEVPTSRAFGFSLSRKVGKAVLRNRLKRQLRDILRRLGPQLGFGFQLVCQVKPQAAEASYAELRQAMMVQCQRAGLMQPVATEPVLPQNDV
ncbi:MAG: ribonuclease P protein component [Candidatus Sericytochromatia bacterium]|nr:ribonuclease P protein component [Candidatus Sericytochromatia bacterium]